MKPYYEDAAITIYHGDCREIIGAIGGVDVVIADPPYGETSLNWDVRVSDWIGAVAGRSLWCFGSMRFLAESWGSFTSAGWSFAQDVVWEKHNGSCFHADRFRRVHEHVAHFYRGPWGDLYHETQTTPDATKRSVRAKARPPHTGHIERIPYESRDGGPRMMRSVLQVRSMHQRASHPTEKPVGIVAPLVRYSCPPSGMVLDPFMGSGTTLVAAKQEGRKAIGIEIEERYCEIAARRCAQECLAL